MQRILVASAYFLFHLFLVSQTIQPSADEEPNLIPPKSASAALTLEALVFGGFALANLKKKKVH
jgi:hypothetical protein